MASESVTWARTIEILRAGARRRLTSAQPVDSSDFDRLDSVTAGATDDIPALTWGELRRLLGDNVRSEADASRGKTPDPIDAAVNAQLAEVGDQVKAFGHQLAKGMPAEKGGE